MSIKISDLPFVADPRLTDSLLADTSDGARRMPISVLPKTLTAEKLLLPGGETTIAQWMEGRPRRNLLDNSYWASREAIVNQLGQDEYIGAGYSIDRCYIQPGTKLTIEDTGIRISQTVNDKQAALQIPLLAAPLIGETVTLSALVDEVQNIEGVRLVSWLGDSGNNQTINASSDGEVIRFSEPGLWSITFQVRDDTAYNCLNSCLRFEKGASALSSIKVRAMQLEPGPIQTLASKNAAGEWVLNTPAPDKALELAKCQRYQQVLSIVAGTVGTIGIAIGHSATVARALVTLPTSLRCNPSIVASDTALSLKYGSKVFITVENVSVFSMTENGVVLEMQGEGITEGHPYELRIGLPVILDANL